MVEKWREGVQMVAESLAPWDSSCEFKPLGDADAAEMLALATLTEPGPFFTRTHQLGDFIGLRREGRLIAMAGERMKPAGFTEVSGVSTHPDFRGQGLAGALMQIVAARIAARGETPFLHAYADNRGAIGLYERLGFRLRCNVNVTMLNCANGSQKT
jgi:predicted GNAT family acetyltransferase